MTRGWTYPEDILSRRRLVFTDEQASLWCNYMRYCESFKSNSEKFQRKIEPRAVTSTFKEIGQAPDEICDHIEVYTKRSLTYDSDIINGFLGILSTNEQLEIPVYHLWGTPLISVTWSWYAHQVSPRTRMLVSGLLWKSVGRAQRRLGFPSWSWTGWTGAAVFVRTNQSLLDKLVLRVETKNGKLVNIDQFEGLAKGFMHYQSVLQPILHIETTMYRVRLQTSEKRIFEWAPMCIWYCCWKDEQGIYVVWLRKNICGSSLMHILENGYEITVVELQEAGINSRSQALLVNERVDIAERVGMAGITRMES
jgi:hypothetical protein